MNLIKLSIQGYKGSFHHQVAQENFGEELQLLERSTFAEVFEDVEHGRAEYGIAAYMNTIAGEIMETRNCIAQYRPKLVADKTLQIEQHLIVVPGVLQEDIRSVYSHPVALEQCRAFLDRHPAWTCVKTDDTAGSVKQIMMQHDRQAAAIAGEFAASLYGAEILRRSIQSSKYNHTSFYIFQKYTRNP